MTTSGLVERLNKGRAMRALRRAVLPPYGLSPQAVSVLRTAATIAGRS